MIQVYQRGGRVYELVTGLLTLGRVDRFKRELIEKTGIRPGDRVLDWGCGTGISGRLVLPFLDGSGELHGVDISPNMMKLAVARARPTDDLKYSFTLRNGFGLQLVEPADVAVACHTLGVLPTDQVEQGVREVWRNLRSGAHIAVTDMYLPPTSSQWSAYYQNAAQFIAQRVYRQDFSGQLLQQLEHFFEPIEVSHRPDLLAFSFLGRRRDTVSE